MLKELVGFLPWILFGYLASKSYMLASEVALLSSLIIAFPEMFHKRVKVFTIGTLIFFAGLMIISMRPDVIELGHWASPASYTMLFLIAFVSILIKKPFTIQYAQEMVEEKYWKTPLFFKINNDITIAWTIGFLVDAICSYIAHGYPAYHHIAFSWIPTAIFIFLIWFNNWYPDYAQEKAVVPVESNVESEPPVN